MQFVTAKQVREGMCVAQDVRDPQGRILIARGQRIGMHHIVRMRKFGIGSLFIDERGGETVAAPQKSELRKECEKVLTNACGNLTQEFTSKKLSMDAVAIQAAIEHLLQALMKSKSPLVTLQQMEAGSDRLLQHSVNVTVLTTALGMDLRLSEPMLRDMASAMLFHDIGMVFLPEELRNKETPLTQREFEEVRTHPSAGFEHLVQSNVVSNVAANLVLRHHEFLNGMGYPQGIGGDKLSILARIASVAEVYDSLTSPRFGLPAAMPDAVISFMIANLGKLFAKEVVVALCRRIALYPVGSAVQINSGEYGVIAGLYPASPTRPVILVKADNKGRMLKEPLIVDLTADPGRSVSRSGSSIEQLVQAKETATPPVPIDLYTAGIG